jgi:hypothetical protein
MKPRHERVRGEPVAQGRRNARTEPFLAVECLSKEWGSVRVQDENDVHMQVLEPVFVEIRFHEAFVFVLANRYASSHAAQPDADLPTELTCSVIAFSARARFLIMNPRSTAENPFMTTLPVASVMKRSITTSVTAVKRRMRRSTSF